MGTAMPRTDDSAPREWQSLPQVRLRGTAKPSSGLSMTVVKKMSDVAFSHQHSYGLKTAPLQRLLQRLAESAFLFNPSSLFICMK